MNPFAPILLGAESSSSNSAVYVFAIYIAGVMFLAWLSNRLLQSKKFLSEYFLGSRSLGVWAFALTFAATSASGGSFMGFPAKVYSHGWIVGLWIAGYMVVPVVVMGLLGKRINQIARKTGAITVPDVLRDRFESPRFGALATVLLVFFMCFNLIAQYKAGSSILQTLLSDVPIFETAKASVASVSNSLPMIGHVDAGHIVALLVFAVVVVIYTTYGGFRAVVWTDVMQGIVMFIGVLLMLPMAIGAVGGLNHATHELLTEQIPRPVEFNVEFANAEDHLDGTLENGSCIWDVQGRLLKITSELPKPESTDAAPKPFVRVYRGKHLLDPNQIDRHMENSLKPMRPDDSAGASTPDSVFPRVADVRYLDEGRKQPHGQLAFGPGYSEDRVDGFLPISLAISFFFMWTFSGAGQPGNMVRLMAFKDSKTLKRSIAMVAVYYSLIYFPLVIIFVCARVLLPGWEDNPDRIMPEMAKALAFGARMPWLAGLLVAAPFAAVMSTMDSFLLMISSSLVRDVYQRNINPEASEQTIKRLTHAVTITIGVLAMLAVVSPPKYLQDIIIFTGSGLSTSFLAPMALSLYWPRMNLQGAVAAMLGGFTVYMTVTGLDHFVSGFQMPFNLHPFLIGFTASLVCGITVTLATPRPPQHLVARYFYANDDAGIKDTGKSSK